MEGLDSGNWDYFTNIKGRKFGMSGIGGHYNYNGDGESFYGRRHKERMKGGL